MTARAASREAFPHIDLSGEAPTIVGTTMKVVELVMSQRAHGWSAEELHFQYPHLSMAQVHAALAYYWDHREQVDADIARRGHFAEQARTDLEDQALARRLRTLKLDA
jgi:uncharacterized protein (DUF433 family)